MALCVSSASSTLFTGLAPLQARNKAAALARPKASHFFSCSCSSSSPPPPDNGVSPHSSGLLHSIEHANKHLVKLALATAIAGILAFTPTGDALAAKSGGRVGGQAFRSGPSPSAPRPSPSAPRADNSRRTNPPSYGAPPLLGGYGSPYYGGGWGWSPFSFFAPGPSIAVGTGGGLGFLVVLVLLTMSVSVLNFIRRRDDDDYYD